MRLKSSALQLSCVIDISWGDDRSDIHTAFCVSGCLMTIKAHQLFFRVCGGREREERKVKVTRHFFPFVPFPYFVSSKKHLCQKETFDPNTINNRVFFCYTKKFLVACRVLYQCCSVRKLMTSFPKFPSYTLLEGLW